MTESERGDAIIEERMNDPDLIYLVEQILGVYGSYDVYLRHEIDPDVVLSDFVAFVRDDRAAKPLCYMTSGHKTFDDLLGGDVLGELHDVIRACYLVDHIQISTIMQFFEQYMCFECYEPSLGLFDNDDTCNDEDDDYYYDDD